MEFFNSHRPFRSLRGFECNGDFASQSFTLALRNRSCVGYSLSNGAASVIIWVPVNTFKMSSGESPLDNARVLVWLENQSFAAWGCSACAWVMPNLGRTLSVKASATIREAFDKHEASNFPVILHRKKSDQRLTRALEVLGLSNNAQTCPPPRLTTVGQSLPRRQPCPTNHTALSANNL